MDVIALHAAGITNAIATLGTAITADQARLMRNYTKKVIICYDSDEPGQKAANKALKVIGDVGLDVSVVVIPGSKDPDEYIKTFGVAKFKDILSSAKIEFEYKMENILSKYDVNLPQDKIKVIQLLENELSQVYSEAEREIYIKVVAKKLELEPKNIADDVNRLIAKHNKEKKADVSRAAKNTILGYQDRVNLDYAKAPAIARCEETVLSLLLLFPEHRKSVFENALLTEDDFYTDLNRRIFMYVKSGYENSDTLDDVNALFTAEEVGRITKIKISRMEFSNNGDDVLKDSITSLKNSVQKKSSEDCSNVNDLNDLINRLRNKTSGN
jgi:DNA primase